MAKKKTAAIVGVTAAVGTVVLAQTLPKTPKEAITWIDAAMHLISQGGMPAVILVLLGALYWHVCVLMPRKEAAWEAKEVKWEAKEVKYEEEIKRLNEQSMTYRDTIMDRLTKIITDGVASHTKLEGILTQVLDFLNSLKKGRANGTA